MVQPIGYFKLWRELMTKPIWLESTPEQKVILITLLSMANFGEKEWEWQGKGYKAKRGQFVTSLPSIAKNAGINITIQNVRTALKRFEKYGFLTDQSTNRNRLITIVNWELYQQNDNELTGNLTGSQQAPNRHLTAREEGKEGKERKNIYTTDFETFYSEYPRPEDKRRTFNNWKTCLKSYSAGELMRACANYKKKVTAMKTEKQFIKSSANFLGKEKYFEDYIEVNIDGDSREDIGTENFKFAEYDLSGGIIRAD